MVRNNARRVVAWDSTRLVFAFIHLKTRVASENMTDNKPGCRGLTNLLYVCFRFFALLWQCHANNNIRFLLTSSLAATYTDGCWLKHGRGIAHQ